MTVYADYAFYERQYLCGRAAVVSSAVFPFYVRKASRCIAQYTHDNIGADVPDAVRLCCCELAELLYQRSNAPAASGVTNEKVGDVSVSYESAEAVRQALPKEIKSVIYSWLADTGLLYRGGRHADK